MIEDKTKEQQPASPAKPKWGQKLRSFWAQLQCMGLLHRHRLRRKTQNRVSNFSRKIAQNAAVPVIGEALYALGYSTEYVFVRAGRGLRSSWLWLWHSAAALLRNTAAIAFPGAAQMFRDLFGPVWLFFRGCGSLLDCGATRGITISEISENGQVIEKFSERVNGRYPVHDVMKPGTDEVLISKDHMMTPEDADLMEKFDIHSVEIRTVLTCKAHSGVCAKCYGMNLATSKPVGPGEAVGIIAAQSIGEPGTQLTMRTFHTGGVAGGDITQGLPRVEELFEARRPKKMATLAEIGGKVRFEEATKGSLLNIIVTADDGDNRIYSVPHTGLRVNDGDVIAKGTQLQDGALSPHDILRIRGTSAVHDYLIQEVLKVYRQQGVDINDKHIEVIVRQMMRKVRVEESGDTNLLSGSMVDLLEYEDANEEIRARNAAGEVNAETGEPLQEAIATQLLMGITKASLATDSWMSAASFQETTKVLTEAAIKGKVDHLVGLKENVIIGKLIPAGAGLNAYREFAEEIVPEPEKPEEEPHEPRIITNAVEV